MKTIFNVRGRGRAVSVLAIAALSFGLAGCGDPAEIALIKKGKLDICPGFSLDALANGYMQDVGWGSTPLDGGGQRVKLIGSITLDEKQVTARMAFIVDPDASSYRFDTLTIDGQLQPNEAAAGLLSTMCIAVGGTGPAKPAS